MGRVLKQVGGRGFYASVHLVYQEAAQDAPTASLDPQLQNDWPGAEWVEGALLGATLALQQAHKTGRCTITWIQGMTADTNPTVVAIAAIRAVWSAIRFVPEKALAARIDDCIDRGLQMNPSGLEGVLIG